MGPSDPIRADPQGPLGPRGPVGPTGPQGPEGLRGPPGGTGTGTGSTGFELKAPLAKMPSNFDGTPEHFEPWVQQIRTFLMAYSEVFIRDKDKILFIINLMRNEKAQECISQLWAKTWINNNMTPDGKLRLTDPLRPFVTVTFTDFVTVLTTRFADPEKPRQAQDKLRTFRQGLLSIQDFLQ